MEISKSTIEEIIGRGDVATAFDIIRTLLRQIRVKNDQIQQQVATMAELRSQFEEALAERDRLSQTSRELAELCKENGLSDLARKILEQQTETTEEEGPITIELE